MAIVTKPRGTNDFLPGEVEKWIYIEGLIREICQQYGYKEIRTPIFEHTELFTRGVGETTDIVEKEMYTFTDRGNRSLTLRPENTAAVVRSYLENKMHTQPIPVKLYYNGPMFRYDRPQAGRYRQFHQFGIESIGGLDPMIDGEIITLVIDFFQRLGLEDLEVHLNSVGCPECRPAYREKLVEHLRTSAHNLCPDCQSRLDRNPMRVLDCKVEKCKQQVGQAPSVLEHLCQECNQHLEGVKSYLDALNIKYVLDPNLVRGLDYYTKTAFEIIYQGLGAQSTVCGGGRYDGLIEECGGSPTPAVGCALGLERLILTLEKKGIELPLAKGADVFLAPLGEKARLAAFKLLAELRKAGIKTEIDYLARGLKAQMKQADRVGAKLTVILGEDELTKGVAVIRSMGESQQEEVTLDIILDTLKNKLRA